MAYHQAHVDHRPHRQFTEYGFACPGRPQDSAQLLDEKHRQYDEFKCLTVTISATFIAALGWEAFTIATLGLLIGGVLAAPFGAMIAKRVNADLLLTFVGAVLTATSTYALYRALT